MQPIIALLSLLSTNSRMRKLLFLLLSLIIGWVVSKGQDKHQFVRLLDVFVYGPVLIWVAYLLPHPLLSYFVLFLGATTITYNLRNYLHIKRHGAFF